MQAPENIPKHKQKMRDGIMSALAAGATTLAAAELSKSKTG